MNRPFRDLVGWVRQWAGDDNLSFSTPALRQMAGLSRLDAPVTLVIADNKILSVLPGAGSKSLGLAVDLCTTTIAAYLCSLTSGPMPPAAAGLPAV